MRGLKYFLPIVIASLLLEGCSRSLPIDELLVRASSALESGKLGSAEIDVKSVLQQDPENAVARSLYGEIYFRRLQTAAAIVEFERSLAQQPSAETRVKLVKALLQAGSSAEIASDWENGRFADIAEDPEFQAALARAYLLQNDFALAREALARTGDASSAYVEVTRALFAMQLDKDPVRARDILEAVVAKEPRQGHAWSLLASISRDGGDREKAIEQLGRAVEANPHSLVDRLQRIRLQIDMGKAADAEEDLARLERQIPNYPPAEFLRGQIFFDAGDYKNAINMFTQVLGKLPDDPGALLLAAHANLREGNLETAQRQLSRYRLSYPSDLQSGLILGAVLLEQGQVKRAETLARKLLEEHGMNVKALGILAAALAAQGMNAESAQYYAQITEQAPESSAALSAMGSQEILAGDMEAGLSSLEAAVALSPDNPTSRERLIEGQMAAGRLDAAEATARAYVDSTGSARAQMYLGRVLIGQQRLDEATTVFNKALELSPGDPAASANLAGLAMARGDTDAAQATLESALEANPGDLGTTMRLAALFEQTGNYPEMEAALRSAMTSNPDAVNPRVALARLELSRGAADAAAATLAPIAGESQQNPVVLDVLVRAYLASGDFEAAENFSRRLVEMRPDDPGTLALAGQVFNSRGRFEVAEQHLRSALARFPSDVVLRKLLIESLVYQGKLEVAGTEVRQLPGDVQEEGPVLVLRGRLALASGDPDGARDLLQRAFDAAPNVNALLFLSGAKWTGGDQQGAIDDQEAWLKQNPRDLLILSNLANMELERGNSERAVVHYRAVLAEQPDDVMALNNLAWLLKDTDADAALAYIERANDLAPSTAAIHDTYAMVELARGDFDRALTLNDKALEGSRSAPDIRYNRAQILAQSGRIDEAKGLLRDLLAGPAFGSKAAAEALLNSL